MLTTSALNVAYFFLGFCNKHGDLITNLKLQKLVYYAQAWYLAFNDKPLFDDPIEAWVHGPVVPTLYETFKEFGRRPIDITVEKIDVPFGVMKHLTEVFGTYGKFSAFDLETLTHSELPWINARQGLPPDAPSNNRISLDDMKAFYRGLLNEQKKT